MIIHDAIDVEVWITLLGNALKKLNTEVEEDTVVIIRYLSNWRTNAAKFLQYQKQNYILL